MNKEEDMPTRNNGRSEVGPTFFSFWNLKTYPGLGAKPDLSGI